MFLIKRSVTHSGPTVIPLEVLRTFEPPPRPMDNTSGIEKLR